MRRAAKAMAAVLAVTVATGMTAGRATDESPKGYDDLVSLFEEFRDAVPPPRKNGVPDYTAEAMEEEARQAKRFLRRVEKIDDSAWPAKYRVDYSIVLAEMRGWDFQHRVLKPWARDPAFYSTTNLGFGPKMEGAMAIPTLPLSDEEATVFGAKLEAVPAILAQAKGNLTDARGDLARLAIKQKMIERNVYDALATALERHHPALVPAALEAREATEEFMRWLEGVHDTLPPHGGVGEENYAWYLKHVMLFPYTPAEMEIIAEREFERSLTFLKLEENEHRDLAMIEPVTSLEDFKAKRRAADEALLAFLEEEEIMTVPDWLTPEESGPYVLPGDRDPAKGGPFDPPVERHFFRQAEDRDAHALRAHNLPGHNFDAGNAKRDDRPIRGRERLFFMDGARVEGWAMYLEEMVLQSGLMDDLPKAREITYILQAKRAARVLPEIKLHMNEWTFEEAKASLTSRTPYWMGPDDAIANFDLELYLRQPGYGIGYYMGKVEFESLLAEQAEALGEDFDLKAFHDNVHEKGLIPLSLIRWEMTGDGTQALEMR